jgi:hypothetical protein
MDEEASDQAAVADPASRHSLEPSMTWLCPRGRVG